MMQEQGQPQGQEQGGGGGGEVAKLFQNVGQGLVYVAKYVEQAAPEGVELAQGLLQGYEKLIEMVAQARQGGGQQRQASQAVPQDAGRANAQQAY